MNLVEGTRYVRQTRKYMELMMVSTTSTAVGKVCGKLYTLAPPYIAQRSTTNPGHTSKHLHRRPYLSNIALVLVWSTARKTSE